MPPSHAFEPFAISVPASSANMGSGFDSVGLALELRIVASVHPGSVGTEWEFGGRYVPTHDGLRDEIARGIARVLGTENVPPLRIAIHNDVPLGKGLGGSAAGAVLGVAIGAHLAIERPSDETLAAIVTEIEGHPDNALPALFGGIVVAAQRSDAPPLYLRFAPLAGMRAVIAIPEIEMPTAQARAILPATYSRRDAVFNVQRAALLGAAFATGRTDLLRTAMEDRIHQPYRASFVPGLAEMLALDDPAIVGTALSGAGPSVIALVQDGGGSVAARMSEHFAAHGVRCIVLELALAAQGVRNEAVAARV